MEESLTPKEIQRLHEAASASWGDDTRPEKFQGHPLPALGQCYVTSEWLKHRMGGHVAQKDGHHFWLSPDKEHALDIVGDHTVFRPGTSQYDGMLQEGDNGIGYQLPKFHRDWHAAPPVYKRASHPLFRDARVINVEPNERAKAFIQRADEAYDG